MCKKLNFFRHQLLKKGEDGAKLEKDSTEMSKPMALHAEGTARISEWLNISDTAKKLYQGKSNSGIAVVITNKLQTGT